MTWPSALAYARWLVRWHRAIVVAAVAIVALGLAIARTLPVYADFSHLLPESTASVRQLRALEKRARVLGTVMVAVVADNADTRRETATHIKDRIVALDANIVSHVTFDKHVAHTFIWENRWLFAPLDDLRQAETLLRQHLEAAKHRANPLYVELDDRPSDRDGPMAIAGLKKRLAILQKEQQDPGEYVSKDGRLQMMIVQTPYAAGDVDKDETLLDHLQAIINEAQSLFPKATVGLAGDVLSSFEEHRAILQGMVSATLVTIVFVFGALFLYYRTFWGVMALFFALGTGTIATFAFTRLTIGHLNLATAFLASIVMGNGINFGIMLLARLLEELRCGKSHDTALAEAIGGTLRGTLAAALTASLAYASLLTTDFRGFRDFGIIAGAGMLLCWISAYTLLPALLVSATRRHLIVARKEPKIGYWLNFLVPKNAALTLVVTFGISIVAGGATVHYLTHDPYEQNFRNLRSDGPALQHEQHWMHEIDRAFGQGISGGFVIGMTDRGRVAPMVARLRAVDENKDANQRLFSRVNSLDDMLPDHQLEKLAILKNIRKMLNTNVLSHMSDAERQEMLALKPPENLVDIKDGDVPYALAWPFVEADGSRGKLILAMSAFDYDIWNVSDLIRFADNVRALKLGDETLLGGSAFLFSDMLRMMEHDGPLATLAAIVAASAVVIFVVGRDRYAWVTLICGGIGTLLMLSVVSLVGLKINFLDFVSLPITIGIGIDYAVNICTRARLEGANKAHRALITAGGAVCLSSYTTIVGYGALLLSSNKGIRSFGFAAILGEITCLSAALILAPALLNVLEQRCAGAKASTSS